MPNTSPNPSSPSYHIAWPQLLPQLLPVLLRRGPRLRAWLTALLSPMTAAGYPTFLALVSRARRELTYNGQTLILEAALNNRFDDNSRRIEIRNDDTEVLPTYLFFEREGQALPTLYYRSELPQPDQMQLTYQVEQRAQGFTVYAPTLQRFDGQLQAFINRYKLALTSYRVLYVQAPPR